MKNTPILCANIAQVMQSLYSKGYRNILNNKMCDRKFCAIKMSLKIRVSKVFSGRKWMGLVIDND